MLSDPDCIFCKIVRGEIPARKVYEDELVLAFHDIHPAAPVHVLVIPKKHIAKLSDVNEEDQPALGRMLWAAARIAEELGCTDGFRTIINVGRIGRQEVFHLHLHVLGGPKPLGRMIQPE
ncbi:MAG: histidine triad nucleotide-binding protein [Casimicrobiaceae bacterium]|nr:histidine triad nucleotide-binding protein [Casimicrobiaceae bacterium]MCX8099163.1 histidine triad nucleotide-binding protein [Casimicrobiaceae bacterium]MDW8312602.1 histidine triad nucleotide-binding protein [Burkholderiales bacterium]